MRKVRFNYISISFLLLVYFALTHWHMSLGVQANRLDPYCFCKDFNYCFIVFFSDPLEIDKQAIGMNHHEWEDEGIFCVTQTVNNNVFCLSVDADSRFWFDFDLIQFISDISKNANQNKKDKYNKQMVFKLFHKKEKQMTYIDICLKRSRKRYTLI